MQNIVFATVQFFVKTLKKSLRTSPETSFTLIQVFNWSKNIFGEIHKIHKGWTGRFPFSVSGVLGDQTQTLQSFDSRLLCCVLYSHFTHIYLSKNTRPINPFNLPLLTCHLP